MATPGPESWALWSSMDPEDDVVDPADQALGDGATLENQADGETPNANVEPAEDAAEVVDDEIVITIGDDAPADAETEGEAGKAPEWVRELRKSNREKDRRIRELEQKVAAPASPAQAAVAVGEKPTMEGCGYDPEKFEVELASWTERKRAVEDQQRQKANAEQAAQAAWQKVLDGYTKAKTALKVPDFEDAEDVVKENLSQVQQGIILKGTRDADTAAKLVFALGKNVKKLKELAALSDPVEFAVAIGEVKTMLKTAPRKTAPAPERVVRGNVAGAAAVDDQLRVLEAEADKTGDRSKVFAYKQKQKAKPAA